MWGRNNIWGGPLEIHADEPDEVVEEHSHRDMTFDRSAYHPSTDEVKQGWLLRPDKTNNNKRKTRHIKNLIVSSIVGVSIFLVLLVITVKFMPHHRHHHIPAYDNYTKALHKAILFFDAQRCNFLILYCSHLQLILKVLNFFSRMGLHVK